MKKISIQPGLEEIEFNGSPYEKKNVKRIIFGHSEISYLPKELKTTFPILSRILMYNIAIKSDLDKNFLKDKFDQIQTFNITKSQNQIHLMTADFFENLPDLKNFGFRYNRVDQIESEFLRHCQRLKLIDMRDNEINELPSNIFSDLPELETIIFQRNGLTYLDEYSFKNSKNLVQIDLVGNKISKIAPETFDGLNRVVVLNMLRNECINFYFFITDNLRSLEVSKLIQESPHITNCYEMWDNATLRSDSHVH